MGDGQESSEKRISILPPQKPPLPLPARTSLFQKVNQPPTSRHLVPMSLPCEYHFRPFRYKAVEREMSCSQVWKESWPRQQPEPRCERIRLQPPAVQPRL